MKKLLSILVALTLLLAAAGCSSNSNTGSTTLTGSSQGFSSEIEVTLTLEDNVITSIEYTSAETADIGEKALPILVEEVVATNSLDVDIIANATVTSNAFLAACSAALESGGINPEDLVATGGEVEKTEETIDVDVVVVGAGGAGMTAAITAAQEGKTVLIVEKAEMVGGNTSRATGGMNAAETKYQEEAGIEDSVELFYEDTMEGGHNINNPDLVRTLAENSAAAIEFLDSIGAHLSNVGSAGGASVARSHRPVDEEGKILAVGSYLVAMFEEACADNGVEILMGTQATEIIMSDGVASGIKATSSKVDYTINAKAVVLATGGFGGNLDMVVEYDPELEGFVSTNASTCTGDGIVMAVAVGANLVDMEQIQIHPTVVQSNGALITESLRGDGAILVNSSGERFVNEVLTRDVVSAAVIAQDTGTAWLIVDHAMYEDSNVIQGYVSKGYMISGETVEELAAAMEVDAETLANTLSNWTAMVQAGEDSEFGRTDMENKEYDLGTAPYYAVKIAPGIHHTMGGVEINTNTEVINTEGEVIPGLFAAGEVTGGVHGGNRLGGNAVADIVVFGRIAGTNAAAYAE